ncbi:DEAD/DEAH box helicase [Flaviaesturariibacter flavus]|uniref:DEAD/DEAH box helicase n=1 Tax=Flaviaesturariibacter flavus TaxID=2502780 RepID=A0A4R1BBW6_9BACT|nr:DEAD/DEAH box helicase [Flaviaesturariibacter flavus]TCJ14438.1 DEAD/DEAH box helicase [Flaviaesturariibacter flavus]
MSSPLFDLPRYLVNLNIEALNPMQEDVLFQSQEHNNIVLLSPTGTGKTLAFLLPLLRGIKPGVKGTQALIVTPSRELALQIEEVFRKMKTGLKVLACYGGHKREIEETSMAGEAPALIVGTPGRLGDHLRRQNIDPDTIHTLVLDEFDKSLELGFQEDLEFVLSQLPNLERRLLTSATRGEELPAFVGMSDARTIDFIPETPERPEALLIQSLRSDGRDKLETLYELLCYVGRGPAIIFCNHRESVERVGAFLAEKSVSHVWYHGALEQRDREIALAKFRNGSASFLVTTDLAARGLDIPHIRFIIHYHLPDTAATFTHRNGRTARVEASGTAVLLLAPDEEVPDFITEPVTPLEIDREAPAPEKPKWATLYVAAGKKDKINKVDIVGFLSQKGGLKKEDIGLIEVKDYAAFVAVRRSAASRVLSDIKDEKLKGRKIKIDMAK